MLERTRNTPLEERLVLRSIVLTTVLALVAAQAGFAQNPSTSSGQAFPSRPLRLVVPFAAGGVTDTSARAVADPLGARLGQPVVVENRPGASGNIGTEQVARSAPDGHTLVLGFDGTMVINPHVFAKIPFDTLRDFAPVTKLGDGREIAQGVERDLREHVGIDHHRTVEAEHQRVAVGRAPCDLLGADVA